MPKSPKSPFLLIVLDGFGCSKDIKYNAIAQANLPNLISWVERFPHTILKASGKAVGLLNNMVGNSEVGFLTLGAGRVIPQPITRMHNDIISGEFFKNSLLLSNLKKIKDNNYLHILGLISNGHVASSLESIKALLEIVIKLKIKNVVIHAFLDGRDTPQESAAKFLKEIDKLWKRYTGEPAPIGSISGRYYAMDRDNNWDRTCKVYNMLTSKNNILDNSTTTSISPDKTFENNNNNNNILDNGTEDKSHDKIDRNILDNKNLNWQAALKYYYSKNISDEFIPPTRLKDFEPIQDNDTVIICNIRADRSRQITSLFDSSTYAKKIRNSNKLAEQDCAKKVIKLKTLITFTQYDNKFDAIALYKQPIIKNTLNDILEKNGKTIFSIAETEKYAHVTYFFNGGRESKRKDETRVLIPSHPIGETYANNPQMSAPEITEAILKSLKNTFSDFYIINYANADMVGHSGDFKATEKAVEIVDKLLGKIYKEAILKLNGTICITADHGNAESMVDPKTGKPKTSHTTNPVPFILINSKFKDSHAINLNNLKSIADVAPFILKYLNLKVPKDMTGSKK